ncbi:MULTISPECIES: hypothetical protein [unclassified Gordonia (in: high G+C Gram-positive bacteria)]|uniref:hypothetical protein n=1 Tax=Gordonia sp. VNQ95 TaxID=3156619 RepID=UPI0032B313DF
MFDAHGPDAAHSSDPEGVRQAAAWSAMYDWLVDSLAGMPAGAVLDLGPSDHDGSGDADDDDLDVPCAQIVVLRERTMMVRLSTAVMDIPAVAAYTVPNAMLDRWNYEDRFRDCTHGYLLSRSRRTVAGICVAWFRDRRAFPSPTALGCSYTAPSAAPHIG